MFAHHIISCWEEFIAISTNIVKLLGFLIDAMNMHIIYKLFETTLKKAHKRAKKQGREVNREL